MSYYPEVGFHFKVEFVDLPGVTDNDVRFQEVAGITTTLGEEPLEEGGENRFTHRLPKPPTYGDLDLKRGMLLDSGLISWFKDAIENFRFTPINVLVHLLDQEHQPLVTWSFEKAYPKAWTVSGMNASQSGIMVDEIKLSYQYFRRV